MNHNKFYIISKDCPNSLVRAKFAMAKNLKEAVEAVLKDAEYDENANKFINIGNDPDKDEYYDELL